MLTDMAGDASLTPRALKSWTKDGVPPHNRCSQDILIEWLQQHYPRYYGTKESGSSTKNQLCKDEICPKFLEVGIHRDASSIRHKVLELETKFKKAMEWRTSLEARHLPSDKLLGIFHPITSTSLSFPPRLMQIHASAFFMLLVFPCIGLIYYD
jgi:hypothetical protein